MAIRFKALRDTLFRCGISLEDLKDLVATYAFIDAHALLHDVLRAFPRARKALLSDARRYARHWVGVRGPREDDPARIVAAAKSSKPPAWPLERDTAAFLVELAKRIRAYVGRVKAEHVLVLFDGPMHTAGRRRVYTKRCRGPIDYDVVQLVSAGLRMSHVLGSEFVAHVCEGQVDHYIPHAARLLGPSVASDCLVFTPDSDRYVAMAIARASALT